MIVLSIDTCDARGEVVLLCDGVALAAANHQSEQDYSSWLLPAVGEVLAKARVEMVQIDAFGVATGPGSFTGSRIGLTTVKAWGEVYRKPIVGVSRLELIARQAWSGANYVGSWTDARRGQVFGAVYRRNGDDLDRLGDEMVMAPGKFVAAAAEMARGEKIAWASTDADCVFNTQEWKARENLAEGFELVSGSLGIGVARIARSAVLAGRFTDALGLDANYVRPSDAEIFWKGGAAHGH